eukprot:scaffold145774_cov23-Prasinocladus_malaysianus.AAC.1
MFAIRQGCIPQTPQSQACHPGGPDALICTLHVRMQFHFIPFHMFMGVVIPAAAAAPAAAACNLSVECTEETDGKKINEEILLGDKVRHSSDFEG